MIPLCISDIASGTSLPVGVEGLLLCFVRYDEDPADLGKVGLSSVGGKVYSGWALYWMYDGERLGVGVDCFEAAGESCDGGVYGICAMV